MQLRLPNFFYYIRTKDTKAVRILLTNAVSPFHISRDGYFLHSSIVEVEGEAMTTERVVEEAF